MKVYILYYSFWDERYIIGVYSTEEKAKVALEADAKSTRGSKESYYIEERDLE